MTRVRLNGPLRDAAMRRIVLGRDVASDEAVALTSEDVARVEHYVTAAGLSREGEEAFGAERDGGAGALERLAAEEIMEGFGRLDAGLLRERRPMILSRAASRIAARETVPADVRSDANAGDVELLLRENLHDGFFVTRAMELRHPTFSGGMSPRVRREVFVATDAAIVLPYDPRRDRVLLVEQFRMGPYGRGDPRPWTLEPIAGRVDAGETPEQTARREAEEEAGLKLCRLEPVGGHYCSPGCSTEYFHLFVGLCDLPDKARGHGGLETENEDIRTHTLQFDRAMGLLDTGEADNGPLILSLLWLAKERDRLRAIG